MSNGDPIHLTIDKIQVKKCEGEKNLHESSANGLNASECEMEINWSIHSTAANYMWQGRQTLEDLWSSKENSAGRKIWRLPLATMGYDICPSERMLLSLNNI